MLVPGQDILTHIHLSWVVTGDLICSPGKSAHSPLHGLSCTFPRIFWLLMRILFNSLEHRISEAALFLLFRILLEESKQFVEIILFLTTKGNLICRKFWCQGTPLGKKLLKIDSIADTLIFTEVDVLYKFFSYPFRIWPVVPWDGIGSLQRSALH